MAASHTWGTVLKSPSMSKAEKHWGTAAHEGTEQENMHNSHAAVFSDSPSRSWYWLIPYLCFESNQMFFSFIYFQRSTFGIVLTLCNACLILTYFWPLLFLYIYHWFFFLWLLMVEAQVTRLKELFYYNYLKM